MMPNTIYEYKRVRVERDEVPICLDAYESFGWEVVDRLSSLVGEGSATIQLKRDRTIINRTELTRLQRNFEGCLEDVRDLQAKSGKIGTSAGLTVGIIGTAFLAGSVFAVTAEEPIIWLCAVLAVPGFLCWGLAKKAYDMAKKREEKRLSSLIDKKYDEMQELIARGKALL